MTEAAGYTPGYPERVTPILKALNVDVESERDRRVLGNLLAELDQADQVANRARGIILVNTHDDTTIDTIARAMLEKPWFTLDGAHGAAARSRARQLLALLTGTPETEARS